MNLSGISSVTYQQSCHFAYYKMDEWDDTLDTIDVLPVSAPIQAQHCSHYMIFGEMYEQWENQIDR